MPEVVAQGFSEKPPSIKSGKSLDGNVVIQRRSDLLIEEQVDNVRTAQESLEKILTEFDHAGTQEEQDSYRSQAEELKLRCDQMLIVLKIITKINDELAYARAELQRALHDGNNIMAARKRVNWLENRMERILGKERHRQPSQAEMGPATDNQSLFSPAGLMGDGRPLNGASIMGYSSMGRSGLSLTDTNQQSYDSRGANVLIGRSSINDKMNRLLPLDITQDATDVEDVKVNADDQKDESQKAGDLSSGWSSSLSSSSSSSSSSVSGFSSVISRCSPRASVTLPTEKDDQEAMENGRQMVEDETVISDKQTITSDKQTVTSDKQTVTSDKQTVTSDKQTVTSDKQTGVSSRASVLAPVFLTEGVAELLPSRDETRSERSRCSRVTIKSPPEFYQVVPVVEPTLPDDTAEYWNSEHHKFQYNEYADALLTINPLSYHQMGLAVPGTFVEDVNRETKLPWRPESGGIQAVDIHKQALDKLSVKVHKMYGKIKEASMLSVEQLKEKEFGAPTLFQNIEARADTPPEDDISMTSYCDSDLSIRESTAETIKDTGSGCGAALQNGSVVIRQVASRLARSFSNGAGPGSSRTLGTAPRSKDALSLPPLDNNRIGSSHSGRLLYYPKPLPYPEKLPHTKMNASKQFPPSSDEYSRSVPGKDPSAERIVNQRNLHKETKFTSSLFKSKQTKQRKLSKTEENFQAMLIEQARQSNEKQNQMSMKSALKMAASVIRLSRAGEIDLESLMGASCKQLPGFDQVAVNTKWKDMKPKSGFLDHSGLKWERVKSIVHNSLESPNTEERIDAARHLGVLRCADTMVNYALRMRLQVDPEQRVVYESMKALILLGCWDKEVIDKLVRFLSIGNYNIKEDILKAIKIAKNAQFVDKRHSSFTALSELISGLCVDSDPEDSISFLAAICMGRLCVIDDNAIMKLRQVMESTTNTHDRAQSLNILVRQMNEHDHVTVAAVLDQLRHSPVWKYRKEAAAHLVAIGARHVKKNEQTEETFQLLEKRLWDEPNKEVRQEVAKALAAQELFAKACERVEKNLSDPNETLRAEAIISIGTLGMKAERIIRSLLEMMELDGSDYVRLMILRTFGVLAHPDKRVLRLLKDKERGDGPLAREARKTLECLPSLKDGKGNRSKKVSRESQQ